MKNTENHKHYKQCRNAFYWTSFNPDRRAKHKVEYFEEVVKELKELGAEEKAINYFEKLFLEDITAESRCASSMVTGAARFNVAKAESARARQNKTFEKMVDFVEKVKKKILNSSTVIKSNDEEAITKIEEKINNLKENHKLMKDLNKLLKKGDKEKVKILAEENNLKVCNLTLEWGFNLAGNLAEIKRLEARVKQIENINSTGDKEIFIAGVKVLFDSLEKRIKFFFDGKPKQEVITLMKSKGFKWSRKNNCWQRLWNNNAIFSIKHYIKPKLEELLIN